MCVWYVDESMYVCMLVFAYYECRCTFTLYKGNIFEFIVSMATILGRGGSGRFRVQPGGYPPAQCLC